MEAKVVAASQQKQFQPFDLVLRVHTLGEAQALRAIHAGTSTNSLQEIIAGTLYHREALDLTTLQKVVSVLGEAVRVELVAQGGSNAQML